MDSPRGKMEISTEKNPSPAAKESTRKQSVKKVEVVASEERV